MIECVCLVPRTQGSPVPELLSLQEKRVWDKVQDGGKPRNRDVGHLLASEPQEGREK